MNHPPFPPPGLLSSLLRPRPQWPASRPEQHRPSASGRPRVRASPLKPLPAAGPTWPETWGLDPGRGRSNKAACGVAPREERVWEETGAPPRRLEPQERGVRTCGPVARPHTPNLVSKQLQRWNPPLGPREEALLSHLLPIRTPEAQSRTSIPATDRRVEIPGPSMEPQRLPRLQPAFSQMAGDCSPERSLLESHRHPRRGAPPGPTPSLWT